MPCGYRRQTHAMLHLSYCMHTDPPHAVEDPMMREVENERVGRPNGKTNTLCNDRQKWHRRGRQRVKEVVYFCPAVLKR